MSMSEPCDVHAGVNARRRLVRIPGCHNLRDLGGYPAAEGRRVRWRTVMRAGRIAPAHPAHVASLATLGLAVVYDLRTAEERRPQPCSSR
jgi:protein-tyrosine phosphatase